MTTKKKKTDQKKSVRRSSLARTLRRITQSDIEMDFVLRLLAFGALASNALYNDASFGGALLQAAGDGMRSDTANFTTYAKQYLTQLNFSADFANNVMPWSMISAPGIKAMGAILEPDDIDYDDGGCYLAIEAALTAVQKVGP